MDSSELKKAYRMTFQTPYGLTVLADILSMLGYFSNDEMAINPRSTAVANTIISRLGVFDGGGVAHFMQGLDYAMGMAIKNAEDDKEE